MKKKIVLALTVLSMLLCVFAIAVSAQDRTSISYTDEAGITHNVPIVKHDVTAETVAAKLNNDATVQKRFVDNGAYSIIKATDGTLTAYPTWYLIEPLGSDPNYVAISEIEYDYVNSISEKTYNRGAMVYVEFPNGMTHARNNGVFGKKANGNPYETNVTHFYFPSTLVGFETSSFAQMPKLKYVFIEAGNKVTSIPSTTFSNSTVEYIQFENLTELETIDGVTNTNLTGDIDLSKTKLKTIKASAFASCENMGKITLPDTVEVIENSAFENTGNAYLASPYLPKNLKSIGKRFFAYNNNLLDTYIFPEGVTQLPDEPFQDSRVGGGPTGKKLNLIFLGEVTGVVYLNGNGHQKHAEEVTVYFAENTKEQYNKNGFYVKPSGSSYTDVERAIRVVFCKGDNVADLIYLTNTNGSNWQSGTFDMPNHTHLGNTVTVANSCGRDGSKTTSCIICDTDIINVLQATGDHNYVDGLCTICGKSLCPSGGDHVLEPEVIFANGFCEAGIYVNKCQNEGCTHEIKIMDLDALFKVLGYSAELNGDTVSFNFKVNEQAISRYEELTGKAISYGVFASMKDNIGNDDIFDESGKVKKGVIAADITDCGFVLCNLKILGFTEAQKEIDLAMGAFVGTTKDEATEYSYLQIGKPSDGEKYFFASYIDVLAMLSSDNDEVA